jgi:hypothetical protein
MTKYGAKKTTVDNIVFDSRAEARYYQELKLLKAGGQILSIDLQPEYVLQEAFSKNGKKYQAVKYRADFLVTYPNGKQEVIDVKGVKTGEYSIKKKLFEKRYTDLTIREVSA